jgi:hypothetical protein
MPEQALMTATDFAQAIKAKYPDYASVPDAELASRMLEKYPEYRDRVQSADFASTNAKDASGAAVVDPNSVGTFASHAWEQINPLNAVRSISSAILHPVNTGKAIGAAQGAVFDKAKASYEQGDYLTAARHFVDYLIPLVGPAIDRSSDLFQAGKWAAGGGDALGIGLSIFGPKALGEWKASAGAKGAPPPRAPLTAAEEASNRFAAERGVPLDAATATGSRTMRAAEKRVANSMGGEGTADALISSQQQNLGRVGSDLADATHPMPVTTEQAGEGIRSSMTDLLKALNQKANTSYGKLREIEGRPENAKQVPDASRTAPVKARQSLEEATLGRVVSGSERMELRRILEELENVEYRGKTYEEAGPGRGGDLDVSGRRPNAPVYHDITDALGYDMTADAMKADIRAALWDGKFRAGGKAALEVAGKRAVGLVTGKPGVVAGHVSRPLLEMGPGFEETAAATQSMPMAVDLRDVKASVQPLYNRLKREGEMAPLMGGKAEALRALDRLVNGPDHAPLSIADAALSDLKTMARAEVPELRTPGQGSVAFAVKHLDEAVRMTAAAAGDDAYEALMTGRAATKEKFVAGDVLEQLRGEPVQVFRQMTAPKDTGIGLLRNVKTHAPAELPKVARAYLEDALDSGDGARPLRPCRSAVFQLAEARAGNEGDPVRRRSDEGTGFLLPAGETGGGKPESERYGAHAHRTELRLPAGDVGAVEAALYASRCPCAHADARSRSEGERGESGKRGETGGVD